MKYPTDSLEVSQVTSRVAVDWEKRPTVPLAKTAATANTRTAKIFLLPLYSAYVLSIRKTRIYQLKCYSPQACEAYLIQRAG